MKITSRLLARFPQKAFATAFSGIGWLFLAKDVIDLGGPATRLTVPTVALISVLRVSDSL